MTVTAAYIREQGVRVAVVQVKRSAVATKARAVEIAAEFSPYFNDDPVVLVSEDGRGRPEYVGRRDLVRFLASRPFGSLPWRRWSLRRKEQ
ncbi:hypothetical protein [Miltoncostaea marina]|uniref:hypothetical protein n=1 Tax=Miltoncostaea marina TaxID=2843215 RepID=UPI001C3E0305|nr:hypothetical protein [Miltoncostaea marina]